MNGSRTNKTLISLVLGAVLAGPVLADYKEHWQKAQALMQKNDRKAAIIELRNALQEKSDSVEARVLLGELYYLEGNLGAAEKELNKARELEGDRALWVKPLGKTYLAMYQPAKVLEVVTEYAKDSNALKADVFALRGLATLQTGNLNEAEKLLQNANSLNPTSPEALFGLGQIARMRNDFAKAESLVNEALRRDPDFVNSYVLSAELLLAKGEHEAALSQMNKAVDRAPNDTRVRLARAEVLLLRSKIKEAWQDINLVLNALPKHPTALYLKGKALLAESKFDDASSALNEALGVMPNYLDAQLLLGFIKVQKQEWRQAEEVLQRVLAQRPDHLPALKMLAQTKLGIGDHKQAMPHIEAGLKKAPEDMQLLALKAHAQVMNREFDKAEKTIEHALTISPDANHLRASLALLQLQEGNSASAINQLESASANSKLVDMSDLMLAAAYLSQKQPEKALELAKKLYSEQPKNLLVINMYGVVKMAMNDIEGARAMFEEALRQDPNFINATLNLVRLDVLAKDYDAALKKLDAELAKNPKVGALAVQKAYMYDLKNEPEKAFEWQRKGWEVDKSNLQTGTAYMRRLLTMNKPFEALSVAQQLVAANPEDAEAHHAVGTAQMANKSHSQAIGSFRQAINLSPNRTDSYLALADAQQANKQPDEAYRTLEQLLRVRPQYWQAMLALGRMDFVAKRYNDALRWAKKLSTDFSLVNAGFHLEADVLSSQGKHAEAVPLYEKAYQINPTVMLAGQWSNALLESGKKNAEAPLLDWMKKHPNSDDGRFALASHYLKANRKSEALKEFHALEKKHPDHIVLLNNLTWMYAEQKDKANTEKYLNKLVATGPKQAELLDTIGYAYLQLGNANKALEFLSKAIEAAPEFGEARYHAALAHKALGNITAAKNVLKPIIDSGKQFSYRAEAEQMYKSL
ncbi:XrtA/PEP-CTERM system TPR-repeat protein PrsT [Permianibacter aggregans]|uniref:Putative PEP-CTERM system TPR-repeat lipoprotein n=1 Tax=Permianibacter aggregans TaxID=1510150 RepID=A0A4R6UPE5_9GAMM|nr:XrtA/PEP-CTERM system TPR-repeat protein PrsT [Permianibacter aggregans]QGX40097.1 PEP-CTERM system TPR-repeat protein PrsT [Permianibacter aggregans]TDQ49088.1 putative PEP-CTERM system TPR-repeat lipoprotein [Permianibacter aggregans]